MSSLKKENLSDKNNATALLFIGVGVFVVITFNLSAFFSRIFVNCLYNISYKHG